MSQRKPTYPIENYILNRWSPRAMSGETLPHEEFMRLIEAARWAPSSYNNQPWRFIYAHRNTPAWEKLFNLLIPFNQSWAQNAAVLVVIVSKNNFAYNNKLSRTHSFDTGAAWENLALQGWAMGLVVHGMEGFDYDKARTALNLPTDTTVEAMCAIGKRAPKETLPDELQGREEPSDRLAIESIAFEGQWQEKSK